MLQSVFRNVNCKVQLKALHDESTDKSFLWFKLQTLSSNKNTSGWGISGWQISLILTWATNWTWININEKDRVTLFYHSFQRLMTKIVSKWISCRGWEVWWRQPRWWHNWKETETLLSYFLYIFFKDINICWLWWRWNMNWLLSPLNGLNTCSAFSAFCA